MTAYRCHRNTQRLTNLPNILLRKLELVAVGGADHLVDKVHTRDALCDRVLNLVYKLSSIPIWYALHFCEFTNVIAEVGWKKLK